MAVGDESILDPVVTLNEIRLAAERIAHVVRRTPLVNAAPAKNPLPGHVSLKLECLQITGSFKARGSVSKLTTLSDDDVARGLVTASGSDRRIGNRVSCMQHGSAAARCTGGTGSA